MANSVPYFNDGEALDHTDLNETVSMLSNNADLAAYERLVRNYITIVGGTYATVYAAGLQAVGFNNEPSFTLGSGSVSMAPQRMWVGLGDTPHSGTDSDRIIAALDMPTTAVVVPANATGSQRTDTLSIPATEATLFSSGTSESRDFQDAVTGALSSQSLNKRYTASTTLTYTAGGSAPANHATIATFTVPNGSSTPTLQYRYWVPMGDVVTTQIQASDLLRESFYTTWSFTTGADVTTDVVGYAKLTHVPNRAFVTTCSLEAKYTSASAGSLVFKYPDQGGGVSTASYTSTTATLAPIRAAVTNSVTLTDGSPSGDYFKFAFGDFVHDKDNYLVMTLNGSGAGDVKIMYLNVTHITYR